jgi:hypothetical protein
VRLYIDGSLVGQGSTSISGTILSGAATLSLGKPTWNTGLEYLNGSLSSVRIYDRALTAQEIADLHALLN